MRIVLAGGGSGGHFFPLIAVAEALNEQARKENIAKCELYYLSREPYSESHLYDHNIIFKYVPAGKIRRYFSLKNIPDVFVTIWGVIVALGRMFVLYPDAVFAKGGFSSFPVLVAARFFRIPVMIHESDTVPGRVNRWAGKFARRVAVSFPEAAEYFPPDVVAHTGHPIRRELLEPISNGAHEHFGIPDDTPVILVLGGSQGAQKINEAVVDALPDIISRYAVIHQAGENNAEAVQQAADVRLYEENHRDRYCVRGFLDAKAQRRAAAISSLVVSRAGSSIFEIGVWGIPSILIPIASSANNHQQSNAYAYARSGAGSVIEERNLTPHILTAEINRILDNREEQETMQRAARSFNKDGAQRIIAEGIFVLARHNRA